LFLLVHGGCQRTIQFKPNLVYRLKLEKEAQESLEGVESKVQLALAEMFGTPNAPSWPIGDSLVDRAKLQRAAGAVKSDRKGAHTGLYREHCVHCHGINGDGGGPIASLLNPYPRDFRPGIYKFKSTTRGAKPTRSDLKKIIVAGMPGNSMPSFRLIPDEDLEAIVDYVIYLSVRGELERRLIRKGIDADDLEIAPTFAGISQAWRESEQKLVQVPTVPEFVMDSRHVQEDDQAIRRSIARGQELFLSPMTSCATCHGPHGRGDGLSKDYDDWTKEWTSQAGVHPADLVRLKPMLKAGALVPRYILPRDFSHGAFRGGGDPESLYLRISQGIEGTSMPAIKLADRPDGVGMTKEQVWDLVNFVLSVESGTGAGRRTTVLN
jgi:mono/diheme cytochrome c family protein